MSERESELLLAINRGLPAEVAKRYRILVDRRRSGSLSPEEHQELHRLTDQAEELQAERIEHLAELSRYAGTTSSRVSQAAYSNACCTSSCSR